EKIGGRQITTRGRGGQPGVAVRALNPRHVFGFPEYPIRNLRMAGPDARFAGLSTTGVPMSFLRLTIILAALTSVAVPMTSAAQEAVRTNEPVIETGDVDRFYALYDAADGRPTAEQLQAYLDGGSEGLRHLARIRNVTGER